MQTWWTFALQVDGRGATIASTCKQIRVYCTKNG